MKNLIAILSLLLAGLFPALAWEYSFPVVEKLARSGERPDMVGVLALYHRYGFGTPQSFPAAEEAITMEAAMHPFCLYSMGILLLNRSRLVSDANMAREMREDSDSLFAKSAPGLIELAAVENPFAQLLLGGLHETGRGVPLDPARAFALYQAAAENGFPLAWYNLGDLLIKGKGTPQDRAAGGRWLRQAVDAGVPIAMYALAQAHFTGQGAQKSSTRGISLLKTAAQKHNHNLSQYELSQIYLKGLQGQKTNQAEGQDYLVAAVRNGNPDATDYARKLGAVVEVPSTYPFTTQAALTGAAPPVSLASSDQPALRSTNLPANAAAQPFGGLASARVPSRPALDPPASADPAFLDFQQRWAAKATQISTVLAEAIVAQMTASAPSVEGVFQALDPASGKPETWLETSFAPENTLLKENPAWAPALKNDKAATYAIVDVPGKLLPLMEQKKFSVAAEELSLFQEGPAGENRISTVLRQALILGWRPLEENLKKPIAASDRLRQESQAALQRGATADALESLQAASALDMRPGDAQALEALRQKEKRAAFETDLGL